jgi:hypothetical protein
LDVSGVQPLDLSFEWKSMILFVVLVTNGGWCDGYEALGVRIVGSSFVRFC